MNSASSTPIYRALREGVGIGNGIDFLSLRLEDALTKEAHRSFARQVVGAEKTERMNIIISYN